jgi:hypothetical protein
MMHMWQYDFNLFYQAGQAVLSGNSPYTILHFNPPYPLAMLFALIAWLPQPVAYALYLLANLGLLWKVMGRQMGFALLAFPVFFALFVGQVDMLLALCALLLGPYALPLVALKPQLAFLIVPYCLLTATRKQLLWSSVIGLVILCLSLLMHPTWIVEWRFITPPVSMYAQHDSNLYWLIPPEIKIPVLVVGMMIGLLIALRTRNQQHSWVWLHLFAPLTNIYSASVLVKWIGPIEVILSWLAMFAMGNSIHFGAPLFVVGISILVRSYLAQRRLKLAAV